MRALWLAPLVVMLLAACSKSGPATSGASTADSGGTRPPAGLGAAAQLDSGNASYRAKDYTAALTHYRAATEQQPRLAAGWFGVYMAQAALGNKAAADSAMNQARSLDPGMAGQHPAPSQGGSAGALPPGHPRMSPESLPAGHPTPPSR